MIQGQIKKIDEYGYVGNVVKLMHSHNAAATKMLVGSLKETQQNYLKEILQSKRVTVQHKGEQTTVARRIIKPKSKQKGQSIIPPPPSSSTMH